MEPIVAEQIERVKQIHTVFDHPLEDVKKCHRCGSVFINDFECEACGYQFQKEWVGNPLGDNSLYSLQRQYQDNLGKLFQRFPWLQPKNSALNVSYRRRLLRRFEVLFFYLENRDLATEEGNKLSLFLMELKDICEEMMILEIPFEKIRRVTHSSKDQFLTDSVFNWLYSVEQDVAKFSLADFIFSYRLFGVLRISFLLLFFALIALVSALSIAFFNIF